MTWTPLLLLMAASAGQAQEVVKTPITPTVDDGPHVFHRADGSVVARWIQSGKLTQKQFEAGKPIELQPREFKVLEYLMRHAGHVITRTMLLENVWDYHFDPQTNVIDVHISRLRAKIDKGHEQALIQTVRGAGYKIDA